MHGEDDQIVPVDISGRKSAKLIRSQGTFLPWLAAWPDRHKCRSSERRPAQIPELGSPSTQGISLNSLRANGVRIFIADPNGEVGRVDVPLTFVVQSESQVTESAHSTLLSSGPNAALLFPELSPAQTARIASLGVIRPITRGEVLIEGGQTNVPFFVLKAGEIEVIRPSALEEILIATVRPTQFTGDISMILGRPAQMRLRVRTSGEVVQLTRDQMHALIQTDAEISEVLMRTFIHRRVAVIAQGIGDVLLIGSVGSGATLRIKQFLTRNGHPFKYLDLDRDADVRQLLDRFRVEPADIPVVICRGEAVLKNPSNQEIADRLGFNAGSITPTGAMSSSSAPDQRVLLPPFTRHPRDSMCWLSRRARQEDQRPQAQKSRTTLDFQREFQVAIWPDAPTPKQRSLVPRS